MSDIYKIAVNLAMTSNAGGVLAALSHQVTGLHTDVKNLEKGFGRLHLAIGGAFAFAIGTGVLSGIKKITEQARELNHQLASVATLSSNATTSANLQARALATARQTAAAVHGTSIDRNVKLYGESYSMFGADGAAAVNGPLAKFGMVLGGISGDYEGSDEKLYAMLRSGDLMGKLVDEKTHKVSPEKLLNFLDTAAKIGAATHGKVSPDTFMQLAQQGGPALSTMSDEGLMSMAMAAQGMGGFRAGTALTGLYSQMIGGKMTKPVAEELQSLGLAGHFTNGPGGHIKFDKGALDNDFTRALQKDPLAASEILQKAMSAHGFTNLESQTGELFKVLGRQTTQRLVSDFIRNLPQMLGERTRLEGAQGVDQQNATRESQDYDRNMKDMHEAWRNFTVEVGLPMTTTAIGIMKQATAAFLNMSAYVSKCDPDKIRAIGTGIGILGASLAVAGGAAMIAALGPAGWIILGIGGILGAVAAYDPKAMEQFVADMKQLMSVLGSMFGWIGGVLGSLKPTGGPNSGAGLGDSMNDMIPQREAYFGGAQLHNLTYGGGTAPASLGQDSAGIIGGPGFNTRGVRNMNPGNIGYGPWARAHGSTGAAGTDTGHGVAVFPSFEAGYAAMASLALAKYHGGRRSLDALIAGRNGWTPGNHAAAANVARAMGISAFADANLDDPHSMELFKHGLSAQELGPNGAKFALARRAGIPPPKAPIVNHIHLNTHLDGKIVAKSVTKHQSQSAYMPGSIGTHDFFGSYFPPGGHQVAT